MSVSETLGLINEPAEREVLADMMRSDTVALDMVQRMEDTEFYEPRNRVMFGAIRRLYMGIEVVNDESILAECRAIAAEFYPKRTVTVDRDYLQAVKTAAGGKAVLASVTVHKLAWLRNAADYAEWLVRSIQHNPDPDGLYTEAQGRWQMLAPAKKEGATLYGWDTIQFAHDAREKRRAEKAAGTLQRFAWPKAWKTWNDYVRPLRAGLVGVLAAPDSVGKSTYLEWIAEGWAINGNKTVLVHLEDSHDYKINRRTARWSSVPLDLIEDETTTPAHDRMIEQAEHQIAEWGSNLHYTHAPSWSMAEILKEIQKLIDEGECECLVLDYIDKCSSDRRQLQLYGNNQYLREGDDMNQLKDFAEKAGIPVFTATQGNKSMQDQHKIQTRQGIDGSGKKSQRAQLVIILTRPLVGLGGLWDGSTKLADEGDYSPVATLRIDKQNRGATRTFHQIFRGECYRIGDPPPGFTVTQLS